MLRIDFVTIFPRMFDPFLAEGVIARGIKAGTVRKSVNPRRVAAFIVAAQTGIIGTAKNAQCEKLMLEAGAALFEYLDSLKA